MIKKNVIIYDGFCVFCNWGVQFIIKRDPNKKFMFTSINTLIAKKLIKKHNLEAVGTDTIFLIANNNSFYKTSAILKIVKELNGYWYLFGIFKFIPINIRDYIYDKIAKNRYKLFSKKQNCMVPDENIKNRFLEE